MAQFSVAWDSHKQSICNGLSSLQQHGEFVDMTLAADGHHVKVHQMIMSLASPYLKEILITANGSHPVIFLNKTSYTTLCALLEYIYTGEVLISRDNLPELVNIGQELHITGLKDMKLELAHQQQLSQTMQAYGNKGQPIGGKYSNGSKLDYTITNPPDRDTDNIAGDNFLNDDSDVQAENNTDVEMDKTADSSSVTTTTISEVADSQLHYTISNQGALQMILNRYIYYLRYTSRKQESGHRQWRCIDYVKGKKCPATVITKGDVVVKRIRAHNHEFHDKQIMKKINMSAVYSAIHDAERLGADKKRLKDQDKPAGQKEPVFLDLTDPK